MKLFLRPLPLPHEPLDLFFIRVSSANGLLGPRHLMSILKLPPACRSKRSDLTRLLEAIGADPASANLLKETARWQNPENKLINLAGTPIPSVIMGRPLGRICPLCLSSGKAFWWLWDLKTIVACEKHGCWLRDRCPRCEAPLDWNRRWLDRCGCEAPLTEPTMAADPRAISLSKTLTRLSTSATTSLDLAEAARLLWFAAVRNSGSVKRGATIDRPDVHSTWQLLEPISGILNDWPSNFGDWVLRDRKVAAESGSLYAHIPLMAEIRHVFGRRSTKIIDAAADAISPEETLPALSKKSTFHRPNAASICPADVAKLLAVSAPRVTQLIKDGTLPGRILGNAGSRRVVVAHRHVGLTEARVRPPRISEIASEIGLPATQIVLLKKAGLLSEEQHCLRDSTNALVSDLKCRAAEHLIPSDGIPLSEIPTLRRPSLAKVLQLVLAGCLPIWWTERGGLSFDQLIVSRTQLLHQADVGMTVREVAQKLSVRTSLVPKLLQAGCLSTTDACKRRRIKVSSVLAFDSQFATSGQLARETGTNTRTIIARLRRAGFRPLVDSVVSKGITSVWRRSDFASIL